MFALLLYGLSILLLDRVVRISYRLFFHPLKSVPGPRLAAASTLYRAYFQVYRDGDHVAQWTRLHEKYGAVVRIAPNTVHFRNPKAFDDIFKYTSKCTKDADFYDHLGQSEALFGMVDENEHKQRFKLVADLFSKKAARDFEPQIRKNANRMCELLELKIDKAKPINLARALRAVALDIVQDFVFDWVPDDLRGLKDEEFGTIFVDTTWDVMDWTAWCFRNFPFTLSISNRLPQWVRKRILPGEYANIKSFNRVLELVNSNLELAPHLKRDSMLRRMAGHVPVSQLTSDCMGTMFGGVINLANMLPYGVFCVCEQGDMQERLYREICSIWPDKSQEIPSYDFLCQQPLLTGVVKESLRLMHGIIVGPPRVIPERGLVVDGSFMPAKTVVATSTMYCHLDPQVFPDPTKFKPKRWANASSEMEKRLVPFSKGKRMCPGKEISIMELYIVFAALFRKYKVEVHDTTAEDFKWKVYVSLHFTGRFFHAVLKPRPNGLCDAPAVN